MFSSVIVGEKSGDPLSPNYVPSIFDHTASTQSREKAESLKRFESRQDTKRKGVDEEQRQDAAKSFIDVNEQSLESSCPVENEVPLGHCSTDR